MPYTVEIEVTSTADATKTASIAIIVAGTIASVSKMILAGDGGTITLPDGSSVSIAPGILKTDQLLTLSEVSYLPTQPPNPAITNVGPGLNLSFANPIQFSAAAVSHLSRREDSRLVSSPKVSSPDDGSVAFQFSINTASNNVTGLTGSVSNVTFVDAVGINSFTGVDGNYDPTAMVVTGNVTSDVLHGLLNDVISQMQFAAMNVTNLNGFLTLLPGPLNLDVDTEGNASWGAYTSCPSGRTLMLVHGMLSSVEGNNRDADKSATFPANVAASIKKNGTYDSVVGFDYDWLQSITTSGGLLSNFLTELAACPGITQLDIEAHSEGVPVSMSAIVQNQRGNSPIKIGHLISVGGPIKGTPAADDFRNLEGLILTSHVSMFVKEIDLATILASPFVKDLQTDSPILANLRSALTPGSQQDSPQIIVVAGNTPIISAFGHRFPSPVCEINCDGVVPLTSALAFDSGLKVYPLAYPVPLFPDGLGHNDLVSNSQVQLAIANQVTADTIPSLLCTNSLECEGPRDSSFQFAGTDFNPTVHNIGVFSQNSSGAVVPLLTTGLQTSDGNVTWPMPVCSQEVGPHSVFAFATVVSNNVMQTVDSGTCLTVGTITTVAGNGTAGYAGDGGSALGAHLFVPTGIAFDLAGNMFIADSSNNVIRRVDAVTQAITTIAGNGVPGYSGDNALAVDAQLHDPTHVVFDRSGNLYITDALNERIRRVDTNTGIITTVAGNGVAGFSGDGGPATSAELNFPDGICLDGSDNVYIGDAQNNRIRKLNVATGIITTVAGTGVAGFSGDGDLAINAELNFPSRPTIDAAGNIYIADFMNNRIRRIDATTNVIVTVAGTGSAGYSGDGEQAGTAELNGPISVTVDDLGNIYIGDANNERIRVVNTGTSSITIAGILVDPGTIATISGTGVAGYQGDGGLATSAEINLPTGLLLDAAGNLYFADGNNNVIRVVALQ